MLLRNFVRTGLLLGAFVGVGCVPFFEPSLRQARQLADSGHPELAISKLEALLPHYPDSAHLRLDLGIAHYKMARSQLHRGNEEAYLTHLTQSLREVVNAARMDPHMPNTHTWLGIISTYRNDLDGALRNFKNALRLGPAIPICYTNIAQIYVYLGEVKRARGWLEKAKEQGASGAYVELIESLAAWRTGDLVEAKDLFAGAYDLSPLTVNTWDESPVDEPIETFRGFAEYCCTNHTCGPNMGDACEFLQMAVHRRKVGEETLRQELEVELEGQRELQKIYRGRGLQLEIDDEG